MKTRLELAKDGPFPGRMDVWAEHNRFFHGLHEQMIGNIIVALSAHLFTLGYYIARETSLQIAEGGIPDGFIETLEPRFRLPNAATYDLAARELLLEPGIPIVETNVQTAIHIHHAASNALVTVIELVSPGNKTSDTSISTYQERRHDLFLSQGVNVVEVDITRSRKRLTLNHVTSAVPYHAAIFVSGEGLRIIPMTFEQAFKPFAIPLFQHVIALDLQAIYDNSYQSLLLAAVLLKNQIYTFDHLPFPSLLTNEQRDQALEAVRVWEVEIARVQGT